MEIYKVQALVVRRLKVRDELHKGYCCTLAGRNILALGNSGQDLHSITKTDPTPHVPNR